MTQVLFARFAKGRNLKHEELAYESVQDSGSLYWTEDDEAALQDRRDEYYSGFMTAVDCFINDKWYE